MSPEAEQLLTALRDCSSTGPRIVTFEELSEKLDMAVPGVREVAMELMVERIAIMTFGGLQLLNMGIRQRRF